jgi:putative sterol carrier protein
VFAKMSMGELGAQAALMSGKLKLKGNMVKALKLSSLADRLNRVIATIPTQF